MKLTFQLNANKNFIILNGYICVSESSRLKIDALLFFHT